MPALLNPQIELEAAQRVRIATMLERAIHGVGNWTVQDGDDLCLPLEYKVEDDGIPTFVGTYEGEPRHVETIMLCNEDIPLRWFDLHMAINDGDEVMVKVA